MSRRNAKQDDKDKEPMCDQEALCVPTFFSLALIVMGLALIIFETSQEAPMPPDQHVKHVEDGNDTTCLLEGVSKEPECHLERSQYHVDSQHVVCFCPARAYVADNAVESEVNVFVGPEHDLARNRTAWCSDVLSRTWPNAIIADPSGNYHWSCNVIVDDDALPCQSSEAESRARKRQKRHWRCFADIAYSTRKHHNCVLPLVPNSPTPCVHLTDGRIILGSKTSLLEQLDGHRGHFTSTRRTTIMIGASILGVGSVVGFITALIFLCMRSQERARRGTKTRSGDDDVDFFSHLGQSSIRRRNRARAPATRIGRYSRDSDYVVDCEEDSETELQHRPNAKTNEKDTLLDCK